MYKSCVLVFLLTLACSALGMDRVILPPEDSSVNSMLFPCPFCHFVAECCGDFVYHLKTHNGNDLGSLAFFDFEIKGFVPTTAKKGNLEQTDASRVVKRGVKRKTGTKNNCSHAVYRSEVESGKEQDLAPDCASKPRKMTVIDMLKQLLHLEYLEPGNILGCIEEIKQMRLSSWAKAAEVTKFEAFCTNVTTLCNQSNDSDSDKYLSFRLLITHLLEVLEARK